MKNYFLILVSLLFVLQSLTAQIGINTTAPDTSAALHIVAKPYGQGFLMPRLFQGRRTSLINPAKGLMAYDLSSNLFYVNRSAGFNDWFAVNPWLSKGDSITPNVMYTHPIVTNVGIGTNMPTAKLDVNGSIRSNNVVSTNTLAVPGFPDNALLPAGAIIMWSNYGGIALPPGWALCDGSNGTPDLRGRFIVGYGTNASPATGDTNPNYAVGQLGGENTHVLTIPELPRHTHLANGDGATISASGGIHTHSISPKGQGGPLSRAGGGSGGIAAIGVEDLETTAVTHSHPNSEFSGKVGDGTTEGMNNQAHENRPPYYVLAFIMKLP